MLRRTNILLLAVLFQFFFCGCTNHSIKEIELQKFKGGSFSFSQVEEGKATVLFFLSPECPLSQNYTLYINNLAVNDLYREYQIYGIIPSNYYSEEQIEDYMNDYGIQVPILLDPKYELTNELEATITPEVFLLDSDGETLYHGAIDNWYLKLGERRQVVTEHYLDDVLSAHSNGKKQSFDNTKPVGCLIE